MNLRSLIGIFKANLPQWVWWCFALWIGGVVFALDGRAPEWGPLILFFVTVIALLGIAEFANTYADRGEDPMFVPSSPLITGELDAGTAKKAFILQNILAGLLLIALLVLTLNYWLVIALAIGWAVGLTYSLPPFRFKETVSAPFFWAIGIVLLPIVGWLSVEPSLNVFIIAFAGFFFVHNLGMEITLTKFRKTFDALMGGHIQLEEGQSIWDLKTIGLGLRVKTAVAIEAIMGLGAFILVPIFWYLGIFDMALSIALLTLPLVFTTLTVVFRIMNPVKNTRKCEQFGGMNYLFIPLLFMAIALTGILHWGFIILACIAYMLVFLLLFRVVHPFGPAYRAL